MKTVLTQDNYRCVVLGERDFELFHTARTACFMEKTADEVPFIDGIKHAIVAQGSAVYWKKIFHARGDDREFFVLLHKERGGEDIAGIIDVNFSRAGEMPYVSTLHVMSRHRGLHLSDMLHQAAREYVLGYTEHSDMGCEIAPDNTASIRAAERNGFIVTRMGEERPDGRQMKHYVRSLRYERGLMQAYGAENVLTGYELR